MSQRQISRPKREQKSRLPFRAPRRKGRVVVEERRLVPYVGGLVPYKTSGPIRQSRRVARVAGRQTPLARSAVLRQPSGFRFSSGAQQNTDVGLVGSTRVSGSEIFTTIVETKGSSIVFAGSDTWAQGIMGGLLSAESLGPRIAYLSRLYTRYAIRSLRIRFIPSCAATVGGSFVLGLTADVASAVGANYVRDSTSFPSMTSGPFYQLVSEMNPSVMTPFREPCVLNYNFSGTRTWRVTPDCTQHLGGVPDADEKGPNLGPSAVVGTMVESWAQIALFGASTSSAAAETGDRGSLEVDYVIDLYGPTYPRVCSVSWIPPVTSSEKFLLLFALAQGDPKRLAALKALAQPKVEDQTLRDKDKYVIVDRNKLDQGTNVARR